MFPITQSSPPLAKIDSTDSILYKRSVTFVDSNKAGKFVLSSWNGIGYDYSCDTIGASAWKLTKYRLYGNCWFFGNLNRLLRFNNLWYSEITLTFHEKYL